ncbi:L-rhamnose-binding lectin CSL3 [Mizuhopecten yessoensis]|uniref:L-rhamnose-binding lectin CSL3 n=1 Tax=Mizuhopecten yessoensis TaxID=6573 RepID=A0A210PZK5_MIZYE|nr:L-rhamnose-binding lectin CSL3 [Mizuhopecten yessoensis]
MSALYGRTTVYSERKCEAKSTMAKVSEACDGKSECILFASNTVFGDPCLGIYKYLDVEYKCIGGQYVSIKTPKQARYFDYTHLDKHGYAVSGNKKSIEFEVKTCNDAHIALMGPTGETGKMYEIVIGGANNKKSWIRLRKLGAAVDARPGTYLDCEEYRKFKISWTDDLILVQSYDDKVGWKEFMKYKDPNHMDVQVVGVSGGLWANVDWKVAIEEVLCERMKNTIKCDAGETIKVMSALYGRTTVYPERKCEAKSTMAKVSETCDRKSKCILYASNTVFGDPCLGILKYLDVEYKCIGGQYVSIKTPKQARYFDYTHLDKHGYAVSGNKKSIEFEVKTCNDAHIALMGPTGETGKMYEIVIGGANNKKSWIRLRKLGAAVDARPGTYLDCEEYRKFKISWTDDLILVQSYDDKVGWKEFMKYKDPNHMDVQVVGVSGGLWADVDWRVSIEGIVRWERTCTMAQNVYNDFVSICK